MLLKQFEVHLECLFEVRSIVVFENVFPGREQAIDLGVTLGDELYDEYVRQFSEAGGNLGQRGVI